MEHLSQRTLPSPTATMALPMPSPPPPSPIPANAAPPNTLNAPTAAPTLLSAAGPAIGPAAALPIHHMTPPRSAPGATSTERLKVVRRRWTDEADYPQLKEVVVANAHMSPRGKKTQQFQVVTNNLNANPRATFKTDHKHAKGRFQLLAKSFEALDKKRATMTTTEEVLTPMELLLVEDERVQRSYRRRVKGTHRLCLLTPVVPSSLLRTSLVCICIGIQESRRTISIRQVSLQRWWVKDTACPPLSPVC